MYSGRLETMMTSKKVTVTDTEFFKLRLKLRFRALYYVTNTLSSQAVASAMRFNFSDIQTLESSIISFQVASFDLRRVRLPLDFYPSIF